MSKEISKKEKVIEALENFVFRVSKGEAISDKEIEVMPEIAKLLIEDGQFTYLRN